MKGNRTSVILLGLPCKLLKGREAFGFVWLSELRLPFVFHGLPQRNGPFCFQVGLVSDFRTFFLAAGMELPRFGLHLLLENLLSLPLTM